MTRPKVLTVYLWELRKLARQNAPISAWARP